MKQVNIIPRVDGNTGIIPVAVYCRVSTKAERQEDSLENQITHYNDVIDADPRYELVEIYYDHGISGFKENRPGFQRMMEDAENGRFKLIITKSITRFARNTQTVLECTRHLKELGIGIYFELQNIHTLTEAGELLMTLYAAFGQAESESSRMHTLMHLKNKNASGHPQRQLQRSLGYSKGGDGEFYPNEYAPIVREIFEMAADGYTPSQIANHLNSCGLKTQNGAAFHRASITRLLQNVAYKGDYIVQQYYVDDNRKQLRNKGERPRIYIEDDHIPIVSRELWERAQPRPSKEKPQNIIAPLPLNDENYPYRHQLYCAKCGHYLHRSVRANRVLWECSGKTRFTTNFCSGVCVTDDEVRTWLPLPPGKHYVVERPSRGRAIVHCTIPETEWKGTEKVHIKSAPALTTENYPYKDHIFCTYCGSRLRRIISNAGKVFWICNTASRNGKQYCKGVRIPDEKLKPLASLEGDFFIGKEIIHGKESYGYSRKPILG